MSFELWIAFVAASVVVLIVPGPTILTVVSYSLAYGRQALAPVVAAVVLGDATAISLSLLGLGAILATSAALFTVLKWVGGLYLIYLGIRFLTAKVSTNGTITEATGHASPKLFAKVYLVAFLNPKGIVFYVAFFPQFVSSNENVAGQLLLLALTFIALGLINVTLYFGFAGLSRNLLSAPRARRRFNVLGGSVLSGAGVYTLLARRPT